MIYYLNKFVEFVDSEDRRLWVEILGELELTLSKVDELLRKNHKFHGQVVEVARRFSQLQGTPLPPFIKYNKEHKTKKEWKVEVWRCLFHNIINKIMDDTNKVIENL